MDSSESQLVIGYLSAFASQLASCSSSTCTQALQGAIPDFQLSVARTFVQSVLYSMGGKLVRSDFKLKRENTPGVIYLSFAYLLLNVGYFGATAHLPLTEAYGLMVITGIITALLHSRLVFYINITKSKIIAFLVCIVGITLAAQPSWLFGQLPRTSKVVHLTLGNISDVPQPMNITSQYIAEGGKEAVLMGYILGMMGGIGMGFMYDINGIILKGIKPIVKVTYASIFCLIGSVAFMFYIEKPVLMMNMTQFLLVLGHSVLSAATSFFFAMSAHYIPGPSLSAVYSFQMIFMIVSQYTIMHSIQPGRHNWIEVLGCLVILFGGSLPSVVDILEHNAKSNELP